MIRKWRKEIHYETDVTRPKFSNYHWKNNLRYYNFVCWGTANFITTSSALIGRLECYFMSFLAPRWDQTICLGPCKDCQVLKFCSGWTQAEPLTKNQRFSSIQRSSETHFSYAYISHILIGRIFQISYLVLNLNYPILL